MPTVSVVIPFYNRIGWLKEAVESVLAQTFRDYQVILVDDGSTEDTSLLREVLSDSRIICLHQANKGRSAARNTGIKAACGKYIAFLDADDLFLPAKLEKQVMLMEQNPHILFSHTSYLRMDSEGKYMEKMESGKFCGQVYPQILTGCPIATPTVMVRAEILREYCFEEDVHVGEDIILWSCIAQKSPVLGMEEPLSKIRIHGAAASNDAYAQLRGNRNVIDYAVRYDRTLPVFFRRQKLGALYVFVACLLQEQGRRWESTKCLVNGLIVWPLIIFGRRFFIALLTILNMYPLPRALLEPPLVRRGLILCRRYAFVAYFPVHLLLFNPREFRKRLKERMAKVWQVAGKNRAT